MAYVKTDWVDDVTPLSATNMNNIEEGLVEHMAELASKHIRETGSNANGSYIKFDDGTMICVVIATLNIAVNTSKAFGYVSSTTEVIFPVNFMAGTSLSISTPNLHGTGPSYWYTFQLDSDVAYTTKLRGRIVRWENSSGGTPSLLLRATVVGRWKA